MASRNKSNTSLSNSMNRINSSTSVNSGHRGSTMTTKKKSPKQTRSFSSDSSDSTKSARSFLSSSSSLYSLSDSKFDLNNSDATSRRRSSIFTRSRESLKSSASKNSSQLSLSSRSSSVESARSSDTNPSHNNLSRANSLKNLEAEYEPPLASNLPLNVYQALFSIKSSNLKIYTLKKEFQDNERKIRNSIEETSSLEEENRVLAEKMVEESSGSIALVEVICGSIHWKLAKEHTNLALIYLEMCKLPRQARVECEKAWKILVEDFRHQTRRELEREKEEREHDETANTDIDDDGMAITPQHIYPDCNKHQMMLNYIYGRASTILKLNEEGESALESAEDYCNRWASELKTSKQVFLKHKRELRAWRQKIYFALAKQYAINRSDRKAMDYYDKCLKILELKKAKHASSSSSSSSSSHEPFIEHDMMIKIYKDMAKIELENGDKESFLKAVDFSKMSIQLAEESEILILIGETKLNAAKIFSQRDDQNSSSKAEELLIEAIALFTKATPGQTNSHAIKCKDELVKFYLRLQRYEDATTILNELVKDKADVHGHFSLKLDSTHKMLASICLVKNDQPTAAKHFKKCLEIEEMNHDKKDKRYLETKEILDNLKKNPNVKVGNETTKPVFQPTKKRIDYSKSDYKLFSPVATNSGANSNLNESNNKSTTSTARGDDSFVGKKISPIK